MKKRKDYRQKTRCVMQIGLLFAISLIGSKVVFAQSKLALTDVIVALRSKKATIEDKNRLLTEGVRTRGVTFVLNSELEKELRAAGAGDILISAINSANPPVAAPSPSPDTPVVAPTPAVVIEKAKSPDYREFQNRGNAVYVLGEYDKAIIEYNRAIALEPKEASIYLSRGMAYVNVQRYEQALSDFTKALELEPEESSAYFNRAKILEKNGKYESALSDYRKAVEFDADNSLAAIAIQRLQPMVETAKVSPPVEREKVVQSENKPPVNVASPALNRVSSNFDTKEKQVSDNKPVETSAKNKPVSEILNVGALNNFAVKLAMPIYPAIERQRRTEGLVVVEVTLDENGEVKEAKAVSGPRTLRIPAENAVRSSRFKPVKVDGQAVPATGFINYNFRSSQ